MAGESSILGDPGDPFRAAREAMVWEQIQRRAVSDESVLRAMREVPRHEFVSANLRYRAYEDAPLPIGQGQTISQPYMVALMTASLRLCGTERVLEIGTGCGYQAAVLACMSREVHSVELLPELARAAGERLQALRYDNVTVHCADGSQGLAEFAPYDAILIAAAARRIPDALLEQLAEGGRMIVPVGEDDVTELIYVQKRREKFNLERRGPCRFVPLVVRQKS